MTDLTPPECIEESFIKIKNIILDLDNCLFDSREWIKHIPLDGSREGWDNFHKHYYLAKPNKSMVSFIKNLIDNFGLEKIYFVTSRENKGDMMKNTEAQISNAFSNSPYFDRIEKYLFMRNENDYRPACEVKQDILLNKILLFDNIDLAIDDDIDNVNMYKKYNIDTLHYTKFID